MNQSTTLAVVGGDVRQAYLAELLHEAGHTVRTFALERRPAAGCTAVSDLQACLDDARAVILPMPVQMGGRQPERAACQCTAHHRRCTRCHSRRNTDAGRCRAFFRTRPRGAERTDTHRLLIPRGAGDPQRGTCRICKKHRLSGYRRQASCRRYSTRAAQNSRLLGGSLSCARASPKYLASTALSHLSHAR